MDELATLVDGVGTRDVGRLGNPITLLGRFQYRHLAREIALLPSRDKIPPLSD
jgi:hypothetical protein